MIAKCLPVVSGANETKQVSGLRRMLCLTALLVVFVTGARAYDLWVGGVQVKSSNESDILGDNIKCYDANVNGGKPKVYYSSASNTLFLYNTKIERTGKDHHAIENKGLPGLRIVLYGSNRLKATESSSVRLDVETSITTTWTGYDMGTTYIVGGSEDAIYAGKDSDGNSPTITIYDANLYIESSSSCFDTSCSPTLNIRNSSVSATCTNNKSGDCYALYDFMSLTIYNSTVTLKGYSQAIKNLTSLTLAAGIYIDSPSDAYFSSSSKTVVTSSGSAANPVVFMRGISIDTANFPDTNFRNWVLAQSYGKDGALTPSEIQNTTTMSPTGQNIADLTGIELFTELTYLDCSQNSLTSLNVSENTKLQTLQCYNNQLPYIDLSQNKSLTDVYCYGNKINGFATMNFVSNLPSTTGANLYFCNNEAITGNAITFDEVKTARKKGWMVLEKKSGTNWIDYFLANGAIAIDEMNFPDRTFRNWVSNMYDEDGYGYLFPEVIETVTQIDIQSRKITSIKGIEHFTALRKLDCSVNSLTSLDVSKNTALQKLICNANSLTSLDVSKNTALTYLNCKDNKLTTLDVSKNTALTDLLCSYNKLTTLDVSNNTKLNDLGCGHNLLSTLDVSKNTELTELGFGNNSISSIDISENTKLEYLYCSSNQLTTLDVSRCKKLIELDCFRNRIRGAGMTELVNSLCNRSGSLKGKLLVCGNAAEGNMMTTVQVKAVKDKNWYVLQHDGSNWVDYEGETPNGDVNDDGKIDEADVDAIVSHLQGESPEGFNEAAADVNEDGVVDSKDALLIGEMAGVPVGIGDALRLNDKGKMINDSWYDLQGRKIKPQTSNLKSQTSTLKSQASKLPKGVNIVGGKKVVIK